MAYQYSNAAREISSIKTISTRNLLMVLASAVDAKTGTCFHSAGCLMHWSQLAKSTFYLAVAELEQAGILSRQRRRQRNRTNQWRLDIRKMEELRVSWDSVKPKDAAPETQDEPVEHKWRMETFQSGETAETCSVCGIGRAASKGIPCENSGQGLPAPKPTTKASVWDVDDDSPQIPGEDNEIPDEHEDSEDGMLHDFCQSVNILMKQKPGTEGYYAPHKILKVAEDNRVNLRRVVDVIDYVTTSAHEGRIHEVDSRLAKSTEKKVVTCAFFQTPKVFPTLAAAYDKHTNQTVSAAFQNEE